MRDDMSDFSSIDEAIEQLQNLKREMEGTSQVDNYDFHYYTKLSNLANLFCCNTLFEVGDFVVWKKGLKNKNIPEYGQPAIVVERLYKPIYDETESSGSPYYMEPMDLVLGVLADDGAFLTYYFDSRRFERMETPSEDISAEEPRSDR